MSKLIYKNYISGEFKSSDNLFDDISPFDGSIVARVSEANKADVDLAVRSARKALTGVWSGMTLDSRCALISRVADEIDKLEIELCKIVPKLTPNKIFIESQVPKIISEEQ